MTNRRFSRKEPPALQQSDVCETTVRPSKYFYSLLVSNYTTKGAKHIFSPNKLGELETCIPWTSKVMLSLSKK